MCLEEIPSWKISVPGNLIYHFYLRKQLKDLENNKQTDIQTDSRLALFSSVKKMTDQKRLEKVRTGQDWLRRVRTGQNWSGLVRTDQDL